jgi:hypothetical protein
LTSALSAHHSDAAYDIQKPITLQGVVRAFLWQNPHIRIDVDIRDATGAIVTWRVEGNPPGRIRGRGLKDAIEIGDRVTIGAYRAKDPSQRSALGYDVLLADGRHFAIGSDP